MSKVYKDVVEEPSAQRAELLALLIRIKGGSPLASEILPRSVATTSIQLSFAQEQLWLLEQLGNLGATYYESMGFRLEGTLDISALERSFEELIRRHESLRTRFGMTAGGPVQVIEPARPFQLEMIDLSSLDKVADEASLQRLMGSEAGRPFDLERGPLFRASAMRLSPEEHILLVTMHHIVSDGWSMRSVLPQELSVLYAAFLQRRPSPLPGLSIQYADYAMWQREWLQGEALERQLSYWKKQLADAPAALELPTDRPRPPTLSYRGARLPVAVAAGLSAALADLGRRRGATLYMVLVAAFQLLLSRWSGQQDVVVGSPIAGRTHRQTEGLIGLFVNTLLIRTDVPGETSFYELLDRVKETALGAYAHQDVPGDVRAAERAAGDTGAARASGAADGAGPWYGQVRSVLAGDGDGGRACRDRRICDGPVRGEDDRAADRQLPDAAGGDRVGPRAAGVGACAAERSGARADRCGVERHSDGVSARQMCA
jgi:Condensation domain